MTKLFQRFDSPAVSNANVDLKDLAIIKVVRDTFFLHQIRPAALQRRVSESRGSIRGSVIPTPKLVEDWEAGRRADPHGLILPTIERLTPVCILSPVLSTDSIVWAWGAFPRFAGVPPRWLADLGLLSPDASVMMLSMKRSGRAATLELLEPADIKGGDISAERLRRPAPYGSFGESQITVGPRVQEGHSRSEEVISVAGHDAEVVQDRRRRDKQVRLREGVTYGLSLLYEATPDH
jgi:hypothetical protein